MGIIRTNHTVALGEVSGHHHTFYGEVEILEEAPHESSIWIVNQDGLMLHQGHGPIKFNKGEIVRTLIQVEHNPFTSIIEKVKD